MARREKLERPVAVKDILQEFLRPGDWQVLEVRRRVRAAWEAAVPPSLGAEARLVDLKRQELWVEVSHGAVVQELQFLKPKILGALQQALGAGVVRQVHFRVGGATPGGRQPPPAPVGNDDLEQQ
uniref:DUF721 domain-containing protein n=1 Tax=Desulfobacca acetoxidans TaxID=60893 RepID=A0A7V4GAC0_9BACT